MGGLLAAVLPLALGAAVSPTLLALQLLVLSGSTRRLLRAWTLAAGSAIVLALYTVLGATVLKGLHAASKPHPSLRAAIVDFVCAGLLVALAIRSRLRRPTAGEQQESRTAARLGNASLPWYLLVGAVGMLTNFSTLVLYLPALHEIERSPVGAPGKAGVAVVLYAITLLPVWLPVAAATVMGRRADPALDRLHDLVGAHTRQIAVTIELVFAGYLAWKGFGELP